MTLLTVVVATYNAEMGIGVTLRSIAAQSELARRDCQFILVDGLSSDETVELVRRSGLFDIIICEKDGGIYDAMNKGARLSRGRWVQFLNAGDSFLSDDSLELVLSCLRGTGRTWAVGGAVNLARSGAPIRNVPHNWARHLWGLQPHCHQATFFRSDAIAALGYHSLNYQTAGDFELIARTGFAFGRPAEIPDLVIAYEGGGISDVSAWHTASRLSEVRKELFNTGTTLKRVETVITLMIAFYNASRIRVGSLRRRLKV